MKIFVWITALIFTLAPSGTWAKKKSTTPTAQQQECNTEDPNCLKGQSQETNPMLAVREVQARSGVAENEYGGDIKTLTFTGDGHLTDDSSPQNNPNSRTRPSSSGNNDQ